MIDDDLPALANVANSASELAPLAELAGERAIFSRDDKGRFLTGNSGGGRPKGARNKLTESFLSAMATDFASSGAAAIAAVRQNDPADYLRLIAFLIPKELIAKHEARHNIDFENISIEEFAKILEQAKKIRMLKSALATVEEG